ncbi:MAG TPA: FAA hydrolase family protein [Candidatus Hydrogenedentes bacterium]|nr:FAA hydrolase family protein [Candidatus Hydrogenedentota bacterium]
MKFARVELDNAGIVYAIEQEDGSLVRATGDPFGEGLVPSTEPVMPSRWLPPVAPTAILCIGRNYAEHAAESGASLPDYPVLFMKNPAAATGHEEPIILPDVCEDEVDYEGELAVVLGKPARDVPKEAALDYVLGYTVAHDVSARIWQSEKGGSQWCRAKSFDTFAPLGPVLVTADELHDPSGLALRTSHNGREVQSSDTSKMIFDVPTLISFLSQATTLLPGTVILSGTPEGVGWSREPRLTLMPGDTVSIRIEGIGTLTNPVKAAWPKSEGS